MCLVQVTQLAPVVQRIPLSPVLFVRLVVTPALLVPVSVIGGAGFRQSSDRFVSFVFKGSTFSFIYFSLLFFLLFVLAAFRIKSDRRFS